MRCGGVGYPSAVLIFVYLGTLYAIIGYRLLGLVVIRELVSGWDGWLGELVGWLGVCLTRN